MTVLVKFESAISAIPPFLRFSLLMCSAVMILAFLADVAVGLLMGILTNKEGTESRIILFLYPFPKWQFYVAIAIIWIVAFGSAYYDSVTVPKNMFYGVFPDKL
jgi:hypothetical protein